MTTMYDSGKFGLVAFPAGVTMNSPHMWQLRTKHSDFLSSCPEFSAWIWDFNPLKVIELEPMFIFYPVSCINKKIRELTV